MCVISAARERLPNEIIPAGAENSKAKYGDEVTYAAAHAIDLNFTTASGASKGPDGGHWLKVKLGEFHCVQQVMTYREDGSIRQTYNCSNSDCTSCDGRDCDNFSLTVTKETSSDSLPSNVPGCKYGDTVKLEKIKENDFVVYEIAIIGKQGEIRDKQWNIRILH